MDVALRVEPSSVADAGFLSSREFPLRVSILAVVALGALAVLVVRLWSLEVLQAPRFVRQASGQASRIVDLPTARGAIVDARRRLLAGTTGALVLTANPYVLGRRGARGAWRAGRRGRALLSRVARLTGVDRGELVASIRRSLRRSPYAPAVVVPRLPRRLAFVLEERATWFPGFEVRAVPERRYPQGALGSEFLGLLGEITPAQLVQRRRLGYGPGDVVGSSGVEAAYDGVLGTPSRHERVPVDALGRPRGGAHVLRRSRSPAYLQLTVDARLQRAAEHAVRDGIAYAHAAGHADAMAGAAVVMSPRTGAIDALVSYPGFNQVAAADDPDYLARLLRGDGNARPLLDRVTQGLYPPGSTFKPVVAEAALASGLLSPRSVLPCTGSFQVGSTVFHNVEAGIDATLTLPQALAISCDTWFYRVGAMLYARQREQGTPDLQLWALRFGFGRPTGIDLPGEAAGLVGTPAWLRRTFSLPWERVWYEGSTVDMAIGQGYLAVTPLQLAVAYAALANGGWIVRPHLANTVLAPSGRVLRRLRFPPRRRLRLPGLWAVREGIYQAAHAQNGTSAAVFGSFPVPVAGKTGTAEAPPGSDDSWYASWAPAGRPRVVVVVLVEHGGFGAQAAAPAAREIYRAYFHLHARRGRT